MAVRLIAVSAVELGKENREEKVTRELRYCSLLAVGIAGIEVICGILAGHKGPERGKLKILRC
jgi:hypothetical protein